MKSIIEGLDSSNFEDIKVVTTNSTLYAKYVVEKLERCPKNRKNNTTFQFLMKLKDIVTILFEFMNALR